MTNTNNNELVTREQAEKEFDNWAFEVKKIKKRLIEGDPALQENRESVIENIMDGTLCIDENGNIIHKLNQPLESLEELTYKPRMQVFEMQKMREYKDTDSMGKAIALISVLSSQNKGLVGKIDSNDFMVASQIIAFYMVG